MQRDPAAQENALLSTVCSAVRRIAHGQLNASDDDQPPTRSTGTSPTEIHRSHSMQTLTVTVDGHA